MGIERRLIVLWVLAAGLGSGCSDDGEELQRRQLLAAQERTAARKQRAESKRALSPQGELLPSETKLGGIVMPRGFEPKFVEKHAWTYDAELPRAKVLEYFERRLTTTSVENKPLGEVVYLGAREKSDPNMPAVVVKVRPLPDRPTGSRIYVGVPQPAPLVEANDDLVRSRLAERRRNAR